MNNKISRSLLLVAVAGLLNIGSASAQTANTSGAGPGVVDPGHPRVNQVNRREGRQQQRIGNGLKNGTLTSKQASHLETRETKLQNREKTDMAKHNGHLTKREQKGLNRQENRISRSIKRDKAANVAKSK
jgi:predicted transglutaminase-like cysteine proteinase